MVVAYDHKRGEKRARLNRREKPEHRRSEGLGDCIDCRLCVAVCPTGIDIRNGTQMECVNCTACIDACDSVMTKIARPVGLIRYASLNSIERGQAFKITPRMIGYSVILCGLALLLGFLVFTRSDVQTTLLRAPGALFQVAPDGQISNLYILKLVNKTSREVPIRLKLLNGGGNLLVLGGRDVVVPKEQLLQTSVLVQFPPNALRDSSLPLRIGVYSKDKLLETVATVFIGPRERM
jgi:cytochrome c oxidase accessory protein FixG